MTTSETQDRRSQIIDAALAIVAESGFDAISVRNVAMQAGIGASTLRHYFPTQRALSEEITSRLLHIELDDRRIGDRRVDPVRRLMECLDQFLASDDQASLLAWLDLVHAAATRGDDSPQAQLLIGFTNAGRQRLVAWLEQLATEGLLRVADVDDAATALFSRIDGLALSMLTPGTRLDHAAARRVLHADVTQLLEH